MTTMTIPLPALTEQQWKTVLTAIGSKTDIPTGEIERTRLNSTEPEAPARTKLVTTIAADQALDELSQEDPRVTKTLQPFFDLTEAEAMTVLHVNNILWETGEALWKPVPAKTA